MRWLTCPCTSLLCSRYTKWATPAHTIPACGAWRVYILQPKLLLSRKKKSCFFSTAGSPVLQGRRRRCRGLRLSAVLSRRASGATLPICLPTSDDRIQRGVGIRAAQGGISAPWLGAFASSSSPPPSSSRGSNLREKNGVKPEKWFSGGRGTKGSVDLECLNEGRSLAATFTRLMTCHLVNLLLKLQNFFCLGYYFQNSTSNLDQMASPLEDRIYNGYLPGHGELPEF
ncbi:uncharacterized protein LOC123426060 [Hordeum vulgare subsp. vulgare]|uniref:uncharacterized protein LOC123426060 n=1 Tax=Hordeum vulgare subsp. vulgare TaxID=112509 RepID=UPI001D1A409C|nr:uncharacterized protein LOC123426060 [Hordeum vulgare subsp. vulgare]